MSELEQLKARINKSADNGVETALIRDDYEPIGDLMIRDLVSTNEYVTRKVPCGYFDYKWKIFKAGFEPC